MRYFVIRGFGRKKDSQGREIDFDRVDRELIGPALALCDFEGGTTQTEESAGNIRADMFALILEADVVVCDITVHNANVFYELGVRHALRKKHTVLIKGSPSADTTPFDLSTDRYLSYPVDDPKQALQALVRAVQAGQFAGRETDSPIFLMLPRLPETDPRRIVVLPLDFTEEVQRAEAARAKGWLRLLAEDVKGLRFEREALRLVGNAQWKTVRDYPGARDTWERVREGLPQDLEANLALANVYERLSRGQGDPTLLEQSSQALQRARDCPDLRPAERAEIAALRGRNLKTMWRRQFEKKATVEERRAKALNTYAKDAYEAYLEGFQLDLNSFFPGVAACQMGRILLTLSDSPRFANLFLGLHRDVNARRYVEDLRRDLPLLERVVGLSIEREIAAEGEQCVWARISQADMLFLTHDEEALAKDPQIAVDAYRSVLDDHESFYWDAARGQLALFEQLGIRAEAARAVMQAFDSEGEPPQAKPLHLVLFAGHGVDAPDAPAPRFPATAAAEQRARELIEAQLQALQSGDAQLLVLCSGAPGADILALEACARLGIETRLCLPMDVKALMAQAEAFTRHPAWCERLLSQVKAHGNGRLLVLQHEAELPTWLRLHSRQDSWARGNRWMLKLAQCWGAQLVTLVALWDGNAQDLSTGGTAQLVRMARQSDWIGTRVIDCGELAAG